MKEGTREWSGSRERERVAILEKEVHVRVPSEGSIWKIGIQCLFQRLVEKM